MPKYVAAEMCHTMNSHWGYGAKDVNCKSLAELIETLCACRKVGANYLLNVGPDAEGEITPLQAALMEGIGDWIRYTGNCIYKAKPCGIKGLNNSKNFALRNGNKLYFFIHDLSISGNSNVTVNCGGAGFKTFTGVPEGIKSLKWVDNDEVLEYKYDNGEFGMNATGFPYGTNLVVRVAEAEL